MHGSGRAMLGSTVVTCSASAPVRFWEYSKDFLREGVHLARESSSPGGRCAALLPERRRATCRWLQTRPAGTRVWSTGADTAAHHGARWVTTCPWCRFSSHLCRCWSAAWLGARSAVGSRSHLMLEYGLCTARPGRCTNTGHRAEAGSRTTDSGADRGHGQENQEEPQIQFIVRALDIPVVTQRWVSTVQTVQRFHRCIS